MSHPLLNVERIEQRPEIYLKSAGSIFAVFGEHTQDSGNISYGVSIGSERYFVKTAGDPDNPRPFSDHGEREALLRNAIRLRHSCDHPALPQLYQVIESPTGPLLVYEWADGELVRKQDDNPKSALERFRQLPVAEIVNALNVIYDLHHELVQRGWIAVDFYDGCVIYDFNRQKLRLVDLDNYRKGPSTNDMGRMFGSTRFMAPEEFELGAPLDERTTVFTMGKTAAVFLSDNTLERAPFQGNDAQYEIMVQACQDDWDKRFPSMAAFFRTWQEASAIDA